MANSNRMSGPTGSQTDVVINLDARFFYGLLVVIGLVVVFAAGLYVGGVFGPGPALPGQAAALSRPPGSQPAAPPAVQQSLPLPLQPPAAPSGAANDPNVIRAAKAHSPDGDHPHLALPEIDASNYVLDMGKIRLSQGTVTKILTIKNTGNRDLVIQRSQVG